MGLDLANGIHLGLSAMNDVVETRTELEEFEAWRGRQLGNRCLRRRMHMKKISVIGATLLGAAVLCAAPLSLNLFQDKGTSLSVDKAQARIGHPLTPGSVAGVHRRVERRAYRRGYYGQGYYVWPRRLLWRRLLWPVAGSACWYTL